MAAVGPGRQSDTREAAAVEQLGGPSPSRPPTLGRRLAIMQKSQMAPRTANPRRDHASSNEFLHLSSSPRPTRRTAGTMSHAAG